MTANLSDDSVIREEYEVVDVASTNTGRAIPIAATRFLRNQCRMAAMLWRRDESIVLFFGATSYLIPIIAAKLSGKTVVLEPRGDVPLTLRLRWEERLPNSVARVLAGVVWTLERIGYRVADAIVTYTPAMADELGLDRFEGKLYSQGARYVDTDAFAVNRPYEDRDRVIGFLGRLDEEKGIRTLATAAKSLPDDIKFVFAGDGSLREWLERELAVEIESGRVELTGWIDHDEVPGILNRFQVLVLPSQPTEGLPTVILESMGCGTPAYAMPVSGVPDVVQEGETGFLMEVVDPDRIVTDLEAILERDDLVTISANCRRLIEDEYSFEQAVARYEEILGAIRVR